MLIKNTFADLFMSILPPQSNERPGEQSAKTPSGEKIPMAMSMMVDSMVRMIQKANKNQSDIEKTGSLDSINEN